MKLKIVILLLAVAGVIISCGDNERFNTNSGDRIPPGKPIITKVKSLNGGARFHFIAPGDEDLMSIDAEYTKENGKTYRFTASYFVDSLDVIGFGDTKPQLVHIYAVDRAGNRSEPVEYIVTPLDPVVSLVAKSIKIIPGFRAFFVDWKNDLLQTVHVHVSFKLPVEGVQRDVKMIFSSNGDEERHIVKDLDIPPTEPVQISIHVKDQYENSTEEIDFGSVFLMEDSKIPKKEWTTPLANDSIFGVPMMWGNGLEGRTRYAYDDIINVERNNNYLHTNTVGRTGVQGQGNVPWNLMIDLGDYYELSRIITHQMHGSSATYNLFSQELFYKSGNVGLYTLWIKNEEEQKWDSITTHRIPIPSGLTELQIVRQALAGDEAYFYPETPQYTKPTRWIRYEALRAFDNNYSATNANNLSELTLFGRLYTGGKQEEPKETDD